MTVLGAWKAATGRQEVGEPFRSPEDSFSDCTSHAYEVVAADVSGDMAYTVGYEHTSARVNGEPRAYTSRVTQVYRREDAEWKVAHRHGDTVSEESD